MCTNVRVYTVRQLGNVNEQVELVAAQLDEVEELKHGFDALGFSQGESLHLPVSIFIPYELRNRWSIPASLCGTL